jgi:hypothetical protein
MTKEGTMKSIIRPFIMATIVTALLLGMTPLVVAAEKNPITTQHPELVFVPHKVKERGTRWLPGRVEVVKGTVHAVGDGYIQVDGENITVSSTARVQLPGRPEAKLEDIQVDMRVTVLAYRTDAGDLVARLIIVIPIQPAQMLWRGYHVGEVISYNPGTNATDGSLVIRNKEGESLTFTIIDGNFRVLPPWHNEPQVGDWVTVIGHRDPIDPDKLIATGAVIHPTKPASLSPGLEQVSGVIHISDHTVAVNSTPPVTLTFDGTTIFILRGLPSADGQIATVFYKVQQDGTGLAKLVLVGLDLPGITSRIRQWLRIHRYLGLA